MLAEVAAPPQGGGRSGFLTAALERRGARAAVDRVGDIDFFGRNPGIGERLAQQTCRPGRRTVWTVFLVASLLSPTRAQSPSLAGMPCKKSKRRAPTCGRRHRLADNGSVAGGGKWSDERGQVIG